MDLEIIRESSKAEVVRFFWNLEAKNCKHSVGEEIMQRLIWLTDTPDFEQEVRNIVKDCNFKKGKYRNNPTLVWTIGNEDNPNRPFKVRDWVLAKINLECLYTCGINEKINVHLDLVNGNLKSFVKQGYAREHPEFQLDRKPPTSKAKIIGIAHRASEKQGTIELVDGAHRVVSMLHNNMEQSEAYIARLKKDTL